MGHLNNISIEELQQSLQETEQKKPALRLIAAIALKNGITQTELAGWFDVERKTIYNWLTRLEDRDFQVAIYDEHRPGRPRKLNEDQLRELKSVLNRHPQDEGYDAPAWSVDLVKELIRERFDTDYSRPSCRRIMKEAGLVYQEIVNASGRTKGQLVGTTSGESPKLRRGWVPD